MICATCHNEARRILVTASGKEACPNCVPGLSEAGGSKTDGILTRNSFRIKQDQAHHEGDMIQPHAYNKASKRVELNEDFVKMYPEQLGSTYNENELLRAGHKSAPLYVKKQHAKAQKIKEEYIKDVTFEGNETKALEKHLK